MNPSQRLLNAIQTYYFNRSRQKDVKWDKEGDLDTISAACPKGYAFEACTGTFWFKRYTKTRIVEYEMNENTFPNFKKSVRKL